jgi:hypothetical protein
VRVHTCQHPISLQGLDIWSGTINLLRVGDDGGTRVAGAVLALGIARIIQHLTCQLNIVVGELANLGIVDTQDLSLFGGTQGQAGNEVHDEEDEAGSDKGVCGTRDGIGQLVSELDPVVVEPATGDDSVAIEMRYVIRSEEGSEDIADETADGVFSEDVEGIIDTNEELELGGVLERVSGGKEEEEEGLTLAPAAPTTP